MMIHSYPNVNNVLLNWRELGDFIEFVHCVQELAFDIYFVRYWNMLLFYILFYCRLQKKQKIVFKNVCQSLSVSLLVSILLPDYEIQQTKIHCVVEPGLKQACSQLTVLTSIPRTRAMNWTRSVHVTRSIPAITAMKQVAPLSQRDRAVGWVSSSSRLEDWKWETIFYEQYFILWFYIL